MFYDTGITVSIYSAEKIRDDIGYTFTINRWPSFIIYNNIFNHVFENGNDITKVLKRLVVCSPWGRWLYKNKIEYKLKLCEMSGITGCDTKVLLEIDDIESAVWVKFYFPKFREFEPK